MNEAESTAPPPTVSVALKRSWGQIKTWVAMQPCEFCGTPRHAWPVPKGADPATLLGAALPPCGRGMVVLTPEAANH